MSRLKFVTVILALGAICAPGASLCTHSMPEAMSCESNQTEMLAVKVSEYRADRLAEYCAAGDIAKYLSYQKTLNYVIEFAIEHGITGAYNRKFAYAGSGYDRGFNLKKPETTQYRTMRENGGKGAGTKPQWHTLSKAEKMQYQSSFLSKMIRENKWIDSRHKIRGEKAYYSREKKLYYTRVKGEKCDFEVWKVSGKTAKHQGAIECTEGRLYEGPRHPDCKFE